MGRRESKGEGVRLGEVRVRPVRDAEERRRWDRVIIICRSRGCSARGCDMWRSRERIGLRWLGGRRERSR